jgi:hypothetical protein
MPLLATRPFTGLLLRGTRRVWHGCCSRGQLWVQSMKQGRLSCTLLLSMARLAVPRCLCWQEGRTCRRRMGMARAC